MSKAPAKTRKCPICKKSAGDEHAPFCSKACKDKDLLNWLDNGYSMPGDPAHIPTEDLD